MQPVTIPTYRVVNDDVDGNVSTAVLHSCSYRNNPYFLLILRSEWYYLLPGTWYYYLVGQQSEFVFCFRKCIIIIRTPLNQSVSRLEPVSLTMLVSSLFASLACQQPGRLVD